MLWRTAEEARMVACGLKVRRPVRRVRAHDRLVRVHHMLHLQHTVIMRKQARHQACSRWRAGRKRRVCAGDLHAGGGHAGAVRRDSGVVSGVQGGTLQTISDEQKHVGLLCHIAISAVQPEGQGSTWRRV